MTFEECVLECAKNDELVAQFNRLLGCNLGRSLRRSPIERVIDMAAGYPGETDKDMATFMAFVYEVVWSRLPREAA